MQNLFPQLPSSVKMSALRLFSLFGASIIHNRTTLSTAPRIRLNKLFPYLINPPIIRFRRCNSSFAAVDTLASNNPERTTHYDPHHPWPEWVAFIDRLKAKGYFLRNPSTAAPAAEVEEGAEGGEGISVADGNIYNDMNLLKDVTLSFARDRFDIFKSLSKEDIQKVVESGCPNLFRKSVNSAKRLRAYLRLDEGHVCSACNLRGSCDRAYVILKESEAAARTVDIMRILLFYALDPLVMSDGEKPPSIALVEASARNLLSSLTVLSETSPDPALPKPAAQASPQKKGSLSLVDNDDVEMKRGDWSCPNCNFMNFAKNLRCLKCKEDGPKRVGPDEFEMKKGDWICSECNFMNFSRNTRCLKCKSEGPKRVNPDEVEMKKGDWNCPQCSFMNFASNRKCLRCQEARPKRQLNPGEWECHSCDFLNYRKNLVCLKCNCERPNEVATQYEDQMWRRPN